MVILSKIPCFNFGEEKSEITFCESHQVSQVNDAQNQFWANINRFAPQQTLLSPEGENLVYQPELIN